MIMLLAYKVSTKLIDCEKRRGGDLSFFFNLKQSLTFTPCIVGKGNQWHVPRITAFIYIISLFIILETIQPIKNGVLLKKSLFHILKASCLM